MVQKRFLIISSRSSFTIVLFNVSLLQQPGVCYLQKPSGVLAGGSDLQYLRISSDLIQLNIKKKKNQTILSL